MADSLVLSAGDLTVESNQVNWCLEESGAVRTGQIGRQNLSEDFETYGQVLTTFT